MTSKRDIGYDHVTGEFFETWTNIPKWGARCEGSIGPIVARHGTITYSHQCRNRGAVKYQGQILCWRHRQCKDSGSLVTWPPKKTDAP